MSMLYLIRSHTRRFVGFSTGTRTSFPSVVNSYFHTTSMTYGLSEPCRWCVTVPVRSSIVWIVIAAMPAVLRMHASFRLVDDDSPGWPKQGDAGDDHGD